MSKIISFLESNLYYLRRFIQCFTKHYMNTDDDDLAKARFQFQPYFPVIILSLVILSCSEKKEEPKPLPPKKTTEAPAAPKRDTGLYRSYYLDGTTSLNTLLKELGEQKAFILYKLNRRDLKHLKEGDTIIVPAGRDNDRV